MRSLFHHSSPLRCSTRWTRPNPSSLDREIGANLTSSKLAAGVQLTGVAKRMTPGVEDGRTWTWWPEC